MYLYFDGKKLEFIYLNSILFNNSIIHHLPKTAEEDKIPSAVYKLSNNIWNKIFLNIITRDPWIITNSKIIGEGQSYREPRNIYWKQSKDNIIDGFDSLVKGKMSPDWKITKQSLKPWKFTGSEKVDKKNLI